VAGVVVYCCASASKSMHRPGGTVVHGRVHCPAYSHKSRADHVRPAATAPDRSGTYLGLCFVVTWKGKLLSSSTFFSRSVFLPFYLQFRPSDSRRIKHVSRYARGDFTSDLVLSSIVKRSRAVWYRYLNWLRLLISDLAVSLLKQSALRICLDQPELKFSHLKFS